MSLNEKKRRKTAKLDSKTEEPADTEAATSDDHHPHQEVREEAVPGNSELDHPALLTKEEVMRIDLVVAAATEEVEELPQALEEMIEKGTDK